MAKRLEIRAVRALAPTEQTTEPPRDIPNEVVKTLSEEVYRLLRRDILAGRLAPGSKLPFRQLAQLYGFGIAPLREALARLASERLVLLEGQRGFSVSPMSREELFDLCILWSEISVASMKIAIERGDENWEAEILAAFHRLQRTKLPASPSDFDAIEKWERLHSQFHMSLIAACGSPWRLHFCSVLSDQFERYRRVILLRMASSTPTAQKVNEEHRKIAEAAVNRDSDHAAQLLTDHFSGNLSYLAEQYQSFAPEAKMPARIRSGG